MVAWIETRITQQESGHKTVATLVVAWIETSLEISACWLQNVATLVVAWIETYWPADDHVENKSPPSWWRGLKQNFDAIAIIKRVVATLVVAWIETGSSTG